MKEQTQRPQGKPQPRIASNAARSPQPGNPPCPRHDLSRPDAHPQPGAARKIAEIRVKITHFFPITPPPSRPTPPTTSAQPRSQKPKTQSARGFSAQTLHIRRAPGCHINTGAKGTTRPEHPREWGKSRVKYA